MNTTCWSQRRGISFPYRSTPLRAGNTVRFNAIVTGATDAPVTWTAPDGGTVDSGGLFLAPGAVGDYRVVATSRADSSKAATAVAHVQLERRSVRKLDHFDRLRRGDRL